MEALLLKIVSVIGGVWLASIEWRLRSVDQKLRQVPSRREVNTQIDIKSEAIKVLQQEIKEDVKEIKEKLDRLIEANHKPS